MKRARECSFGLPLVAAVVLAGAARIAPAAQFRAGQSVVVATDQVIADDLYVTGETVTVDGRIEGDLVASGREVRVNGEVTGDVIACGQAVIIDGTVGDDVRIAGMALQLGSSAAIADDVVAAGFSLETKDDSATGGSLLFAGFQALLVGDIDESLHGGMSSLEIQGRVGGDSEVEVNGDPEMFPFAQYLPSPVPLPTVAGGLTIGDGARIDGRFEYTSPNEASGAGAGSPTLIRVAPAAATAERTEPVRKSPWPGRLFRWVGLALLGLLLAWRTPGWLDRRSTAIEARPMLSAGVGFLGVAALPIGIVMATVAIGLLAALLGLMKLGNLGALVLVLGLVTVALVVLLFWLIASYLAPVVVGLCTGRWMLERIAADRARGLVAPLLAGLVMLGLLRVVPILGTLVALGVVLIGWGATLLWFWKGARAG